MGLFSESLVTNLLAITVTLLLVAIIFFKRRYNYWKHKGVPTIPTTIPFGNGFDLMLQKQGLQAVFTKFYKNFKERGLKYGGVYLFYKPVFVPVDPKLLKSIFIKDFQHFTNHANYVNEKIDPLNGHLFLLKDEKWKNLRTKLTPTFTSGKMKMMFQTLVDCSGGLTTIVDELIHRQQPVDIKEVAARFTCDVIGSCAFGIDCNCLVNPDSEFIKYGKKVFESSPLQALRIFAMLVAPQILNIFKMKLINQAVEAFFMNVVKETVDYRQKNNVIKKDFMQLLMNLTDYNSNENKLNEADNPNEKMLSLTEITAQAFVFCLAGFETSSTTLSFCFYELVTNPDVQEKLRQEIKEVLEKHDDKITYDAIMEMTYMEKCLNETLRKYPPVSVLTRECTQEYHIPDTNIILERGTAVFIPSMAIHHDPEYYPDPQKFDPERFSEENKLKRQPCTWLPFGEGPRICIGLRFGIMQAKVALTVLLKHHKFTINKKTAQPLQFDPRTPILTAKEDVWLNAEKISMVRS